jgi:peptidyl-tRNA hydrolase
MFDHALHIIVPTYMNSLNAGKAMAQVSHATSMLHEAIKMEDDERWPLPDKFDTWRKEANGFGTCLVFGVDNEDTFNHFMMQAEVEINVQRMCAHIGTVIDPTYPINDGGKTWLVEAETCGFIFCSRADFAKLNRSFRLRLHP